MRRIVVFLLAVPPGTAIFNDMSQPGIGQLHNIHGDGQWGVKRRGHSMSPPIQPSSPTYHKTPPAATWNGAFSTHKLSTLPAAPSKETQPPEHEDQNYENILQHMTDVTQEINRLQIELSEKTKLIDGEYQERAQAEKSLSFMESKIGPAVKQLADMKHGLWSLYNELHQNLENGKPKPVTVTKLKHDFQDLQMSIENETTFYDDKVREASDENKALQAQLEQTKVGPETLSKGEDDKAKIDHLRHTIVENERLEMENSRLAEEKIKLQKMLEFTVNPLGSIAKMQWDKFSKAVFKPHTDEIRTTSFQCDSQLRSINREISTQKADNQQLQDGIQILQSEDPVNYLQKTIRTFFAQRGQSVEATAALYHQEENIIQQISLLANSLFSVSRKGGLGLPVDTSTGMQGEAQQVNHAVEEIVAGMHQLLTNQHATVNKIQDETADLLMGVPDAAHVPQI